MAKILFTNVKSGDTGQWSRVLETVPAYLREKILVKQIPLDRLKSLTGYLLVRRLFGMYSPHAQDVLSVLQFSADGKPFLRGGSNFSISHCDNIVVAALAGTAVGIDVERVRPIDHLLYEEYFSEAEWKAIASGPDANERFFQLWTRKEAVIKAVGAIRELRSFEVLTNQAQIDDHYFFLKEVPLETGYQCHIAFSGAAEEIDVSSLPIEKLYGD